MEAINIKLKVRPCFIISVVISAVISGACFIYLVFITNWPGWFALAACGGLFLLLLLAAGKSRLLWAALGIYALLLYALNIAPYTYGNAYYVDYHPELNGIALDLPPERLNDLLIPEVLRNRRVVISADSAYHFVINSYSVDMESLEIDIPHNLESRSEWTQYTTRIAQWAQMPDGRFGAPTEEGQIRHLYVWLPSIEDAERLIVFNNEQYELFIMPDTAFYERGGHIA